MFMPWSRHFAAAIIVIALTACTAADPTGSSEAAAASPSGRASPPESPASAEPSRIAPTTEPLAEGVISTDDEEYRVSFTADGLRAYFARSSAFFPQARQATIYESARVDGTWTEPVVVAFSGTHPDIDPWVAPGGQSLYFSSIRPTGGESRGDAELFRVDRVGEGWSEPVHLAALGSPSDELGATVAGDGTIVFASDRPGGSGGWDLYAASPADEGYAEPEPIRELNSAVWEFNPAIDAAGETLVFTSIGRDGGPGLGDLFVATRSGSGWSEARPLAVNTSADEYHPSLAPDGRTLYFVRRTTQGDLLSVPWAEAAPLD
jgi:Tol biopolymer transport system component